MCFIKGGWFVLNRPCRCLPTDLGRSCMYVCILLLVHINVSIYIYIVCNKICAFTKAIEYSGKKRAKIIVGFWQQQQQLQQPLRFTLAFYFADGKLVFACCIDLSTMCICVCVCVCLFE